LIKDAFTDVLNNNNFLDVDICSAGIVAAEVVGMLKGNPCENFP